MKIRPFVPLLIAIVLMATGCSSKKTVLPYFADIAQVEAGSLPQMNYMPVIQPDDELQITVTSSDHAATAAFNQPEVNPARRNALTTASSPRMLTYMVDSEGDINFPVLGRIHAAGLTVEQLRDKLISEISRTVTDPQVSVAMVNFTVVVAGEVHQPQTVTVQRNRFTILEALSAAGDMTEFGERSNVLLIRENGGEREYIHINLNESDILSSPYYYLQPNDYIYVAPNKVRQENSKYNQNNGFKLSIISTVVSAASVIASLVIALTVK
ncbi:MAG: polysaccharide biosynthesis/export family protein [Muribaculaceae bacterium]|nr:polysaccharide biosynthesis/export family protein [Muribaculaceae bacterium]